MAVYMVSYDLNKSGKNYTDLIERLKKIGTNWWHHLDSTWLICHVGTAASIRDSLSPYIDNDDELLVVKLVKNDAAWKGFNADGAKWLRDNL